MLQVSGLVAGKAQGYPATSNGTWCTADAGTAFAWVLKSSDDQPWSFVPTGYSQFALKKTTVSTWYFAVLPVDPNSKKKASKRKQNDEGPENDEDTVKSFGKNKQNKKET